MKLIPFTDEHLAQRVATRPPEYLTEIEPALVRQSGGSGGQFIDVEHPVYLAARAKYRAAPILCPRCGTAMQGGCRRACPGCHFEEGCGN